MQNVHVKRYTHPDTHGYAGTIEPEDRSWVLFIPNSGKAPELYVEVEVPESEDTPDGPTVKGYTPAIFMQPELLKAIADDDQDAVVKAMGCPAPKE